MRKHFFYEMYEFYNIILRFSLLNFYFYQNKMFQIMNVRYLILYITWILFPLGLQAQMAPDFTIFDKEENEVSLSALRGKYVLLDFWGTWCQACMKELPDMKRFHKKHRKELVIISVDCHDEERAWKEIVEDYKLKWTQVRDTKENSLAEKYGVSEFFPPSSSSTPMEKILFRLNGENKQF